MAFKIKNSLAVLMILFSAIGFAQTETNGKLKTVVVADYELGYALHKPGNTKD